MRCLWLTLAEPDPPTNGQFLYSGALIRSLALCGARIDVVGFQRCGGTRVHGLQEGSVRWWLAEDSAFSGRKSLTSPLPYVACRMQRPTMRKMVDRLLAESSPDDWDAVIFDSLGPAWALQRLLDYFEGARHRPLFVYLAQNHEASLAPQVASIHPSAMKRYSYALDALKVGWLERRLGDHCDLITANAPEDAALFRKQWPNTPVDLLLPAYTGTRVEQREIGPGTPRRVAIVGSLDWLPKRVNQGLPRAKPAPLFAAAGIELMVVGSADPAVLADLRARTKAASFTGQVEEIGGYLRTARLGIAAERVGGGFKLKTLDYIFHRVPMIVLEGTAPGLDLRDGESVVVCRTQQEIAEAVIRLIDDFPVLNRLQDAAFTACREEFDLAGPGRKLARLIARVASTRPQRPLAPADSGVASTVARRSVA